MHAPPAPGQDWPTPATPQQPNPWLEQLSRGMWLRGHISLFAMGSVILLTANLVSGSRGIWADTAISAWAVLLIAHGILMVIARLMQELLADEEDDDIRPASEMHWNTPSTWTLPQRVRERGSSASGPAAPATPTLDPEASAAAAAARDRGAKAKPQPAPEEKPAGQAPAAEPEPDASERVSWKAATDAAWLAPRETDRDPETPEKKRDDEDDFTPLKFD